MSSAWPSTWPPKAEVRALLLTAQPWLGRWLRGLHRYASDAAVIAVVLHALRMFAQGRTENESLELYMASASEGYVERLSSMLTPDSDHASDGDGTAVLPVLEVPVGDAGAQKSFGKGRVTRVLIEAS